MKKRLMACFMAVCMLCTVLAPVTGTIAAEVVAETPVATEVPATPVPATEVPATQVPATEAPATEVPATEVPATEVPATEVPATEVPATEMPATEVPATEEPAVVSEEPTIEPTEEPVVSEEPTIEPTEEPAASEEPTIEPTEEPVASEEPTVEPTEEPAPVSVSVVADAVCVFVGETVSMNVAIGGGVGPFSMTMKINGADVQSWSELAAGEHSAAYTVSSSGEHRIEFVVADANGATASGADVVAVAVHVDEETAADWEKTVEDVELTGDWRVDLIEIAKTQLGYEESARNFSLNEEGNIQGYTRYGAWYGLPYEEWCAMFVSFCLNYAEIPSGEYPRESGCANWVDKLSRWGVYEETGNGYEPQAGDVVFFSRNEEGLADHVGIVERVSESTIYTIEGNSAKMVRRQEYARNDDTIIGYANTAKLMEMAQAAAEPTATPVPVVLPEIPEGGAIGCTNVEGVNVRSDATTESECVVTIEAAGSEVLVLGAVEANGAVWYAVAYADAYMGFIRGDLVTIKLQEELTPVEPEATPEPELPEETVCACHAEDGSRICAEDCACDCHAEGEMPEVEDELLACECFDEFGTLVCAEDCVCACHAEVETEEVCVCYDEFGTLVCAEGCACACHVPAAEIPAIAHEPWQAGVTEMMLTCAVDGAVSYSWQRGLADENGEMVWEEIASTESAEILLSTALTDLAYTYRCVAALADETQITSGEITLIDAELVQWMRETQVTEEMLVRAMGAKSLDSMVIENDAVVYVRTGEVWARIDATTGYMIDERTGLVIAVIDMENGLIYPISTESADEE